MQAVVDKEIEDMIAMGVIERSEAAYASPLVLVKKADGSYRVCVSSFRAFYHSHSYHVFNFFVNNCLHSYMV